MTLKKVDLLGQILVNLLLSLMKLFIILVLLALKEGHLLVSHLLFGQVFMSCCNICRALEISCRPVLSCSLYYSSY